MNKLLHGIWRLVTGEHFRQAAIMRAEELAEQQRNEHVRKREQVAKAQRRAEERAESARREAELLPLRREEERLRLLALEAERHQAAALAEKESAELKKAKLEAYLKWQEKIDNRDEKDRIKSLRDAPAESDDKAFGGTSCPPFSNRGFNWKWHRTSRGWKQR